MLVPHCFRMTIKGQSNQWVSSPKSSTPTSRTILCKAWASFLPLQHFYVHHANCPIHYFTRLHCVTFPPNFLLWVLWESDHIFHYIHCKVVHYFTQHNLMFSMATIVYKKLTMISDSLSYKNCIITIKSLIRISLDLYMCLDPNTSSAWFDPDLLNSGSGGNTDNNALLGAW